MRRLFRRAFNLTAVVSAALCLLMTVLFARHVRGPHPPLRLLPLGAYSISAAGDELWLAEGTRSVLPGGGAPLSGLDLLFAVPPVLWVRSMVSARRRRRARPGFCRGCGYDLRATPEEGGALLDRCPECGRVPAGNATKE